MGGGGGRVWVEGGLETCKHALVRACIIIVPFERNEGSTVINRGKQRHITSAYTLFPTTL